MTDMIDWVDGKGPVFCDEGRLNGDGPPVCYVRPLVGAANDAHVWGLRVAGRWSFESKSLSKLAARKQAAKTFLHLKQIQDLAT